VLMIYVLCPYLLKEIFPKMVKLLIWVCTFSSRKEKLKCILIFIAYLYLFVPSTN